MLPPPQQQPPQPPPQPQHHHMDALEMRERPRIPPKPANLRLNNNNSSDPPRDPPQGLQPEQQPRQTATAEQPPQPSPSQDAIGRQPARKRVVSDFDFGRTLGEGSYSTVVEATERATGRVYAAKILDKRHIIKEKKIKYVNIERDILQALHHPFVVRLHYAFQDSQSLYFILDLAPNGELLAWIRKLGGLAEACARFYLAEIITAVEYMHAERTLHRDIKPENILLGSNMHILVTDFGTAKMFKKDEPDQRAYSFVGTAEYVSPELLTDKAADCNSDLWAIGCIAFQLLTGRPPFKGSNEYQTFQKVLKLDYAFPPGVPPHARDLVERILVLDPASRLGSTQRGGLRELRAHPFFRGLEWHGLPAQTPPPMAGPAGRGPGDEPPRVAPPAIPPKPALLRQPSAPTDDPAGALCSARGSSSDGFGTEKTSDDSFSATPSASTDPLAGALPNLAAYRITAPVHIHGGGGGTQRTMPPPPPPPPPSSQQQHGLPAASRAAYGHAPPRAGDSSEIYNVRLNDHVPPPLKAEEMAEVDSYHRSNGRPQPPPLHPLSPSTTDYYANASYRPPHYSVYTTTDALGRPPRASARSNDDSWLARLRAALCCGN
ncbi:3-phosphoinositide dependent protein kinase-1 [Coemansia javaensis]|uniref:non-specific serine/threonine protein kinase n=1 Tax=Coemansia javaensis TaxID=2761396 RepID=A0A9W8H8T7_9FUNG|nr:3-phosphoinositide dependent protein kinase-1 [Coemansia javaensis]